MVLSPSDDFIILERIFKSDDNYIVKVLNLYSKKIYLSVYDRKERKIIRVIKDSKYFDEISSEYKSFKGEEFISQKYKSIIEDDNYSADIPYSRFSFFRFDHKDIILRHMNYSILDKKKNKVFIPCCGKHQDHENIKKNWGKYIDDFYICKEIPKLEGYIIYDKESFDDYILGTPIDRIIHVKKEVFDYQESIIKSFWDMISSIPGVNPIDIEGEKEFTIKFKSSGVEIKMIGNKIMSSE